MLEASIHLHTLTGISLCFSILYATMFNLPGVLIREIYIQSLLYRDRYKKWYQSKEKKDNLLDLIEKRLNRLQVVARLNGLTSYELSSMVIGRLKVKVHKPTTNKHIQNCLMYIGLFLAIMFALFLFFFLSCTPCQRFVRMYGRKMLFQLKHYWDWQDVYYTRCLIFSNRLAWWADSSKPLVPNYKWSSLSSQSCNYCEEVNHIESYSLSSFQQNNTKLHEHFSFMLVNKIPFMYQDRTLTDEIKAWPLSVLGDVQSWKKVIIS